jgi:hypothetical protein
LLAPENKNNNPIDNLISNIPMEDVSLPLLALKNILMADIYV